jgi:Uma2 family endonuclease
MATLTTSAPVIDVPENCELVYGQVYEVEPMSGYAAGVASRMNAELTVFVHKHKSGTVYNETLFAIPVPDDENRARKPDLAYVSFKLWPADKPFPYRGAPLDVVPELLVEVVSPTDSFEDVVAKAGEYLQAGAKLVWVVSPRTKTVFVYSDSDDTTELKPQKTLTGGSVLPGFAVRVADLFPPVLP